MNNLRVVVLVSSDVSDIYFANQLIKNLTVVGVLVENQHENPKISARLGKLLKLAVKPKLLSQKISNELILKRYYERSGKIDAEHFGIEGKKLFPGENCKVIYTKNVRDINQPVYVGEIKKLSPDVIAVCGSSILKKDIIAIPPKGVLNLHGGLSQKYRGVWTTLWAIYNEEPEYIGFTVHYVNAGIDTGNIVYQGRPDISDSDNPEMLYVKVVKSGIQMMIKAIQDIQNNTIRSYPQEGMGDLYLGKMVTPQVIRKAWENTDNGVLNEYLKNKAARDQKVLKMIDQVGILQN